MAKNYTFAEAVRIINEGKDMEAITDIGRRYPVLLHKVTKVAVKAGEDLVDLMNFMPDYLTANKVNTAMKAVVGETADAEDAEADEAAESVEEKTADPAVEETTENGAPDYESMSGKQLWDILGKAGLRKTAKSTKKADLVAACKAMDAAKAGATEEAETAEAETAEVEAPANPYEGKSAMELFKECKARGIKAEAKKPAKFYADLLVKADAEAAAAEAETESEDEDWGDENPNEHKAAMQPAKKADKKPAKKAAKKEEAADEDDDWDI